MNSATMPNEFAPGQGPHRGGCQIMQNIVSGQKTSSTNSNVTPPTGSGEHSGAVRQDGRRVQRDRSGTVEDEGEESELPSRAGVPAVDEAAERSALRRERAVVVAGKPVGDDA